MKKFLEVVNPIKWEFRKENILNVIDNPFDYNMPVYNKEDVELWINLYEKLKSFKKVREILKENGLPPRIDTLRLRIKKYFGNRYIEWLNKVKSENQ